MKKKPKEEKKVVIKKINKNEVSQEEQDEILRWLDSKVINGKIVEEGK